VERVGVLHDELAAAHQAGARAQFVAELGLDLEQGERQLPIAAHVVADQIDDHFFVRRTDDEVRALAILEAKKLVAVVIPAPGFLHSFGRDNRGQEYLLRPARFISSRIMREIFCTTRQPSGKNE